MTTSVFSVVLYVVAGNIVLA